MLQTFAASEPLSTESLKPSRSTVVVDTTLLRIIAVSMVHLFSKSLASLERCMCEQEVIRTAYVSLIDQCGGAPKAQ